jgi:RNA polymerase sigma-B factor
LVADHRWLAQMVGRRLARRGEPIDDLVQVAMIGILKAVERFDPEMGVTFRTYASATAEGEVRRHYRDATWGIHVTRSLQERYLAVSGAREHLSSSLGRSPTVEDVAGYLMLQPDEVIEAMCVGANYRAMSIDAPVTDGRGDSAPAEADLPPASGLWGDDVLALRIDVRRALERLTPRERTVVFLRYFREMTQSEIAGALGLSQVHVSRLLRTALVHLRTTFPPEPPPTAAPRPSAADMLAVRAG